MSQPVPHPPEETRSGDAPDGECRPGVFVLPTSHAQRRLWFLDRFDPGSPLYNIPLAFRLRGELDLRRLRSALDALAERHETLRTTFAIEDEVPVQVVEPHRSVSLPVVDLAGLPPERIREEAERVTLVEARRPFDLARGPLFRAAVVRTAPRSHRLLATFHHIVADGWSLAVFHGELGALYRSGGDPATLPELPVQYGDYAVWQEDWLEGDETADQLAHWRARLEDAPDAMELPLAARRPAGRGHRGGTRTRALPGPVLERLDALARDEGATRFMVYLAAWKLLLFRLTHHVGRPDVIVGTPVAGRVLEETEGLIGLFVNTLVLRTDCSGDPSFRELVRRVRRTAVDAFSHQELPFETLVEELVDERDPSFEPLVQVTFGLEQTGGASTPDLPGIEVAVLPVDPGTSKFDLSLFLEPASGTQDDEGGGGLRATLTFARDLYGDVDAERMLRSYQTLLEGIVRAPDRPVSTLPLIPDAEHHRVLVEWSATGGAPFPPEGIRAPTLHELVTERAERSRDAVALASLREDDGWCLTHGELQRRANRLARYLVALGAGPGDRVGLSMHRSPRLVEALLAVLGAGAAYVPLDPDYPEERLGFMLEDAGVRLLITERGVVEKLGGIAERPDFELLVLDDPAEERRIAELSAHSPGVEVPAESLAYLIYTSGSTGRPKGVAIPHRSAAAMVLWARQTFGGDELDGVFAATSVNFDLSVFELFVPLAAGGRVILADDALSLSELESGERVRLVNTVPSAMTELVRLGALPRSVATVNLAGEALTRELVDGIYSGSGTERVVNLYGPSEDTTYSTIEPVPRDETDEPSIGRPVEGTRAYVLDDALRPVPAGVPGELHLAGAGLARGYHGRPAGTAESFVPDPCSGLPGGRLYRTGDLVRFLPDGRLRFLGRIDHQVKLRGFRIEPGEIEAALARHPAVGEAAVLVQPGGRGDDRLVAYVAPSSERGPPARELEAHLRGRLPAYMVPGAYVLLDDMPLTPNGKVDRHALSAIDPRGGPSPDPVDLVAPRGPEEEALAGIWCELLGIEEVGVHQSFFELGGHSLLATRVVSRVRRLFGVDVPLRRLFREPTVAELAVLVRELRHTDLPEAPPPERVARVARAGEEPSLPASYAQERLWFLERLGEDEGAYNLPAALELRGPLEPAPLARALAVIVRRHEALRTVFAEAEGGDASVVQTVLREAPPALPVVDVGALPAERRPAESRRAAAGSAARPFDLEAGPLLRSVLVRRSAEEHLLAVTQHHIVSDGWSVGVLFRELGTLYGAFAGGGTDRSDPLEPLEIQYADFAVWQRRRLSGDFLEGELSHWRERLAGLPPVLDLPTDRPRPSVRSSRGGRCLVRLDRDLVDRLRRLARGRGASLYMVCLVAFQGLLGRLAGTEDLAVGTPVAGRTLAAVEELIGLFVNTLVLRGDLSGDPPFQELVDRVRETALAAYDHQELPFEKLVEELRPERSLSHSPLFQVMLTLQNAFEEPPSLPGLEAVPVEVGRETAKLDLRLGLKERAGGLEGEVEFRRDVFDRTTVARMARQLETLLDAAAADPERRLSELPLLSPSARHAVVHEWSGAPSAPPVAVSLQELIARRAEERPDAVALEAGRDQLTYAELQRRAADLAARLAAAGAGVDRPVAVFLERSPAFVVTLAAAVRIGAPSLPLDPEYPAERLAFMLEDAAPAAVVASEALRDELPEGGAPVLSVGTGVVDGRAAETLAIPAPELLARAPAYVLYTSGSTGRPNGVAVSQAAVVEHLRAMAEVLPLHPSDTVLWKTPSSFDPSVWELWAPLAAGARLAAARPGGHREPVYLVDAVRTARATVLRLVPSLFEAMLEDPGFDGCPSLRRLFVGGEVLPPSAARRFLAGSGAELVNSYGPTEATVTATLHRLRPLGPPGPDPVDDPVPIGRPLGNLRARVLDSRLRPVPAGVVGELTLSGPTLAVGYRDRPGLTAERFVPDPFADGSSSPDRVQRGARLYRTGDLAKLRPDGRVGFVGRIDQQVKLRGVRVELGEIESLLAAREGVARAAAVVRKDRPGDRRLVAYAVVEPGEEAPSADELRDGLARRLPPAVVPAAVILLPELPRLPNGKVDRRALSREGPAPEPIRAGAPAVPPRGPLEELVAGIWSEVLAVEEIGVHDDFFDLGGHSLLATRVISRLRNRAGVGVPLRRLFEERTVARLARLVEEAGEEAEAAGLPPLVPISRDGPLPASFAQERLWFLDRFGSDRAVYNLPAPRRLRGVLDLPALARAFVDLVGRQESLRTVLARPRAEKEPGRELPESAAVQVVRPIESFLGVPLLPVVDLSRLPEPAREDALRSLALDEARRPFDLGAGPLFRAPLARLADDDHALLLALHHTISDGWSTGVLFRELATLYRGGLGDPGGATLPELPVQYADFAVWQRRWLSGATLEREVGFWRERLAGAPEIVELPTDRPRPAEQTTRGGLVSWHLPEETTRALRKLARERRASLFAVLLAGFQALIARFTGGTDLPVGTPVANRNRPETEGLIGFFANTLVLRSDLGGDPGFGEIVDRVREVSLEAFAHQELPFEKVVEELRPERNLSHSPLFQVVLALQNVPEATADLPGLEMEAIPLDWRSAKFDLTVAVREAGRLSGGLAGQAEYNRDLFDPTTVRRFLGSFAVLLAGAAADPERRLSELPVTPAAERHQLLWEWSRGGPDPLPETEPEPKAVWNRVAARAGQRPDATALTAGGRCLTYGGLAADSDRLAGRLAARLRERHGTVPSEPVVALLAGRSIETAVAALAVWKVGGAYLPLDPAHPEERLATMLEDSRAAAVLVRSGLEDTLPRTGVPRLRIDSRTDPPTGTAEMEVPPVTEEPDRLAYVIYTSGSTGKPKGVELTHRGLSNLVAWHREAYGIEPGDRTALLAGPGFDASVWELWPTLAVGGSLHVPDESLRTAPGELAGWLARERITVTFLATPLAEVLLTVRKGTAETDDPTGLRYLLTGGDRLHRPPDRDLPFTLVNHYGPSESTVVTTAGAVDPGDRTPPPIGRPIPGLRVHLLDRALRPVPIGIPGELVVTGRGLARGYRGRPAQTAELFVPDPLSGWLDAGSAPDGAGGRLYKTGDLARRLPDGRIDFLGRIDSQVQVRGFRVELGEIESVLAEHPALREVAVAFRPLLGSEAGGEGVLAAYPVLQDGETLDVEDLRAFVGERLPESMVPAAFVPLPELPLTSNGKVDRRALPEPDEGRRTRWGARIPPRGPIEELVAEVWAQLLPSSPEGGIGAHDDFFDRGGHSLLATRVTSRIGELTGLELPLRALFESPTLAGLARRLERALDGTPGADEGRELSEPLVRLPRDEHRAVDGSTVFPASFTQERLWFLGRYGAEPSQYNVPVPVRLTGRLEPARLARALGRIVRRHESLRTVFGRRDTEVAQRILPENAPWIGKLPVIDLGGLPEPARRRTARRLATAEARAPFDLSRGPLFRARLVRSGTREGGEEHLLLLCAHHIVFDGWSLGVLFRELEALYGRSGEDGAPDEELPPLPIQYADFTVWQRRWLSGRVLERQIESWRDRLEGAPAVVDLPTDRPRRPVHTLMGSAERVALRGELVSGLRKLSRERGATLFMILLAAFQTVLTRLGSGDDVPVGGPVAGRSRREVEGLIGCFVNTLVFRGDLSGDPSFARLLARTRERALEAFAHQDLPFEKLVEELQPERNLSHTPIFQVMLSLQKGEARAPRLPGVDVEPYAGGTRTGPKFDLTLGLTEASDDAEPRLEGDLTYNRALFDPATVRRLVEHFRRLVASAVADPERRLSELEILAPAQRHQILREWNDTARPLEECPEEGLEDACLHHLFEARAAERPDAVAVVAGSPRGGEEHLTYGALDRLAERIAADLRRRGAGPGSFVGVCMGRRPEMAAAVLGVHKAGAAYVPLETTWPDERIGWIVAERRIEHLITETSERARAEALEDRGLKRALLVDDFVVGPDGDPAAEPDALGPERVGSADAATAPDDVAYVIFTSGSTGRPKGVVVQHRPAVNLVSWVNRTFAVGPEDRLLFVTALSFDLSVYDLFGILGAGGTVRLASGEERADPGRQIKILTRERVTFWDSAPAALQQLAPIFPRAGSDPAGQPALRLVFLSGDWVPLSLPDRIRESFPDADVVALGGATEATVWSNYFPVERVKASWASIPYGRPITNARYHVLDGALRPCPVGVAGDLFIAGECLSLGYSGMPRETAWSHLPDPFAASSGGAPERAPGAVMYRTGDRARYFPDGNLEFLGRVDSQVKVRGFRIELGEIESVLIEHPRVAEVVVLAREDVPGDQRLVAYHLPAGETPATDEELEALAAERLPEYMLPSAYVPRERWPLSPTGKLDRGALPAPGEVEEEEAPETPPEVPLRSGVERTIASVWREVLGVASVGRDENFFELGGHSLLLLRVHERLEEELGRELEMLELFRNSTVASLARALGEEAEEGEAPVPARRRPAPEAGSGAVAVVGMAGRFPGADDLEALWRNLRDGVESIRSFGDEELIEAGFDPRFLDDPTLVKARGALDDPDLFDAGFFGYSPREAEIIDPQQRLFLECAWQALEDAGYGAGGTSDGRGRGDDLPGLSAGAGRGRVGVFGGVSESSYLHRLRGDPELARTVGGQQIAISNNPDYLATRVSYKLHLTGPSVAVQTACSTSLVAAHLACRSLLEGACDLALAGGSSVRAREVSPYRFVEGGINSPDGHTRAFDAEARGVVGGSGVGVVALKRLEDALEAGDTIRAVIRGSAVNNDGGLKVGFTAPSAEGQAEAIREAMEAARVDPATVGYVEAHGTATPMGDPIEVEGLTTAFERAERASETAGGEAPSRGSCALGSIKTNIGHLDAAAGVAGLIKAVLALEHREIPPSLHFEEPNPRIDFDGSPFFVADRLLPWKSDGGPRRAGVSSFGIGGTNAHLVLEEAPDAEEATEDEATERSAELVVLSARNAAALDRATERLARHLQERPELSLGDVAWTLQRGRRAFGERRAVVCRAPDGAPTALRELDRRWERRGTVTAEPPRIAFLFPGQGAQYPRMAESLYREEPAFRDAFDRCAETLAPELEADPAGPTIRGGDLREILYPEPDAAGEELWEQAAERLARTELTQPVLFAVEYALACLWRSWGIEPEAMVGHSIGEYVAATLAGVFELDDALRLVAARGRLMGARPEGKMLAIRLGERRVLEHLEGLDGPGEQGPVTLAAVNGPESCVASGPADAVRALEERLEAEGVGCRGLATSHAFHSAMMEPAAAALRDLVARVERRPPRIPFAANVTGTWIEADEATDPDYWARQLMSPVRFGDGLETLVGGADGAAEGWALLEVGPGRTLSRLARSHPVAGGARTIAHSLRHPRQTGTDRDRILVALGDLWVHGVEPDWEAHHRESRRRRVPLPTYPFDRRSFWIGGGAPAGRPEPEPATADGEGRAGTVELTEVENAVAGAWHDLLGVEIEDRDQDFFELGGSSLMAVQLGARLRDDLRVDLPSDFLLQASTVGELAELVESRRAAEESGEAPPESTCLVPLRRKGSRRPLFLVHQVGGHVYSFRPLVRELPGDQPVYGLRSRGLEGDEEPFGTVEEMAEHYLELIREVQPRGPYRIGGASMGGMVAFEMAHRLRGAGETVELLTLMDTPSGDQMPPKPKEDFDVTVAVFAGRVELDRDEVAGMDVDEQLRYALEKAERDSGGAGFGLEDARRLAAVLRANLEALFAYRPEPFDGSMVFFRAIERRPGEPPRPEVPWIERLREGIHIHRVPGTHATMHEPPNVEVMAEHLIRHLESGRSGGAG